MLNKLGRTLPFFVIAIPSMAVAQLSDFPMSPIQYPSAMSATPLLNISTTSETVRRSVDKKIDSQEFATPSLTYKVSLQRRQANLASFASRMEAKDPRGAVELRRIIKSADVIAQIDQAMRPIGLNANNLADCYALYWVVAWEAKYNRDMGSSPSLYRAVKAQVAKSMESAPQFSSFGDATKQEAAEALLLQAALIQTAREVFQNDKTQLSLLSKAVDQGARATGFDLNSMMLTPNGFVPRTGGRSDAADGSGDTQLAANDAGGEAADASFSDYALYAAAYTGLLAGVFAIGKGLARRG